MGRHKAAVFMDCFRQLAGSRLLPANVLNHTSGQSVAEKRYSLPVGIFVLRGEELRFRLRSWQVNAWGRAPMRVRFSLSHFPSRRSEFHPIGLQAVPRLFCGNPPFVNAIRYWITATPPQAGAR